jgi:hypothetical protein
MSRRTTSNQLRSKTAFIKSTLIQIDRRTTIKDNTPCLILSWQQELDEQEHYDYQERLNLCIVIQARAEFARAGKLDLFLEPFDKVIQDDEDISLSTIVKQYADDKDTSEDEEETQEQAEEAALVPMKNVLANLDKLKMFEMQQKDGSQEIISKIRSIWIHNLAKENAVKKQVSLFDLQGFPVRPSEPSPVSNSIYKPQG